jgi:plastocyanin
VLALSRLRLAWMLGLLLCAAAASPASAAQVKMPGAIPSVEYEGMQKLHYEFGPIAIAPGQNSIEFEAIEGLKPKVPGYITRFEPNLIRRNGDVPGVDELHLHHGVWLMRNYPTFAAGEEKTIFQFPRGFGYRYAPEDPWIMNHMIHNLLPGKDTVYLTYSIDFVPADSAAAQQITEIKPLWMDVAGISAYPVFDVKRGWGGKDGRYTFPDEVVKAAERRKIGSAQRFTADRDMTLIGTAGHLHPGGISTDLEMRRGKYRMNIFKSQAKYWEPAGAVSWDVAMTVSDPDWRVKMSRGDELHLSATYDATRAAWYESMGINFVWYAEGHTPDAKDPFVQPVSARGEITHGHLPENDNHGGGRIGLPDPRRLLQGAPAGTVAINDFVYGRGDLGMTGWRGRPPVVRKGRSILFKNRDSPQDIWHTITACKEPCNKRTGIAYPLADGRVQFDSGQLGFGPRFASPVAQRDTWSTPKNLKAGTYTFFCRVHPFMRGAFRVKGKRGAARAAAR